MIKKLFLLIVLSVLSFGAISQSANANNFSILATVNDDAISQADVDARMMLVMASSAMKPTAENKARLMPQVLNALIEEQIKIQEAERQNLSVTNQEISQGFANLAAQNRLEPAQFDEMMARQGIPKTTLLNQIKSQIAWTKVISNVLRPQIDVTEADVMAYQQRLEKNVGQTEYLVGEIYLPVTNPNEEEKTRALAGKIIEEMSERNVPFKMLAAQFSRAPGAAQNGGLTWVMKGQLPDELENAVMVLDKGAVSAPIRGLSGYHIMMMSDERTMSADTMPPEQEITNKIGLERLERLQNRHLSDLKASAFIERRN